ncbi:MAG: mercury methylation corrinoid protein HgcA [Chloroflexota bacterium]
MSLANWWDHALARCGFNRMGHRVEPGIYAIGHPSPDSPVFVTANYTLSFDSLRTALAGTDCYVMVLDTLGVNVWCAAGKGTFGTEEVVRRIESTGLSQLVRHRKVVLPQLSAPGVAAHDVKRRTGFKVEFGPVRAADLPEYLRRGTPTPEMRRVRFTLRDRLVLVPVEIHGVLPWFLAAAVVQVLTGNSGAILPLAVSMLSGAALFPILLPWIPTRQFSGKGLILGGLAAVPFAISVVLPDSAGGVQLYQALKAANRLLVLPPITAFISLNFTGSTTFTSRTGVRREISRFIPVMAAMFGVGLALSIALSFWKG